MKFDFAWGDRGIPWRVKYCDRDSVTLISGHQFLWGEITGGCAIGDRLVILSFASYMPGIVLDSQCLTLETDKGLRRIHNALFLKRWGAMDKISI